MTMYKHYKGGLYQFLFVATHSETEEQLVIYKNEEQRVFARPYEMFFENVIVEGKEEPRFKKLT
ncbi:DUF1653 domain-containing protein [Gracilibacillus xinjiangensis]|uniref:DUF1653 domain-containing protein n=1 Tax=Gracilibacillus xinjiangensis TaxID=1193282 RepID=A0ABV8WSK0_9BACI